MSDNFSLPEIGLVKLKTVLSVIPVSKTTWFIGIKKGIYPKPIKIGARASAWDAREIRRLIDELCTPPLDNEEE